MTTEAPPPPSPFPPDDDPVDSPRTSSATPNRKVSFGTLSEFSSPDEDLSAALPTQQTPSPSPRRMYSLTGSFSDMDLNHVERNRAASAGYSPYPTPKTGSPEDGLSPPELHRRTGSTGGGAGAAAGMAGLPGMMPQQGLTAARRSSEPEFKRIAGLDGPATATTHRFPRHLSVSESLDGKRRQAQVQQQQPGLLWQQQHNPHNQQYQRPASPDVKETYVIDKSVDESGHKRVNKYLVVRELGRGVHGKVKLCYHAETKLPYAMKIVKKPVKKRFGHREANPMEKLRVEIAILKKCDHQNVVKLYEVLDNPESTKIYLILEYLEGGSIRYCDENSQPLLSIDASRRYFRDVLLGLEYLHYQGIVHRDLKPQNLLLTGDNRVKISDFGVSHQSSEEGDTDLALAKTAGTPAFFAPELCVGSSATAHPTTKAIDIWALGVTLYCFIYGTIPFQAESHFELYQTILNEPVRFKEDDEVSDQLKDLLLRMLEKDPTKRITFPEIKVHPWVTEDLDSINEWLSQNDPAAKESIHVTLDEVKQAVTLFAKFKRGIRKLSISLGNKLKSPKSSTELDSDTSSSYSLNRSHSKRPSASSLDMAVIRGSTYSDDAINTPIGHFRSPSNVSSNGNFRPTIKSSISQELFPGSDTDSLDEPPVSLKSPRSKSPNPKSLTEIEEEVDQHHMGSSLFPWGGKKKDKAKHRG